MAGFWSIRSIMYGRTAVRPIKASLEDQMSTLKFVRAYARYLASTLATISFKITSN